MDKDPICILRACPLINIGRRTLVGRGNGQMVHLRNGTPEHHAGYHLPLSDPIPFDQNNRHLHRYHQFCHLHWRHSPSHQSFFGFNSGGWEGIFGIRSNDLICENHSWCTSQSHHHIYCFNAADIFPTYLDIRTLLNISLVPQQRKGRLLGFVYINRCSTNKEIQILI